MFTILGAAIVAGIHTSYRGTVVYTVPAEGYPYVVADGAVQLFDKTNQWVIPQYSTTLLQTRYNRVRNPSNASSAALIWYDSDTSIGLEPGTEIDLDLDVDSNTVTYTTFSVVNGTATYHSPDPLTMNQSEGTTSIRTKHYIIRTHGGNTAAIGTDYSVNYTKSLTTVTVLRGIVEFRLNKNGATTTINANQQGRFSNDGTVSEVKPYP